jgi:hypothetical protein
LVFLQLILRLLPLSIRKRILAPPSSPFAPSSPSVDRFDLSTRALKQHAAASEGRAEAFDSDLLPPPAFNDHLGYYQVLGLQVTYYLRVYLAVVPAACLFQQSGRLR